MSNIFCSSIGKKLVMSLSGLFLVVFLLLHVSVNLTALFSRAAYETACNFMDTNIFIQVMVPVLALGFAIHILFSLIITLKNQKARPVKYSVSNKTEVSSWAAKNMFVLGLIVFCFLALHLTHFWAKMQLQHFMGKHGENPYDLLVTLFSQWYYCVIYVVWILALYFHISHGFWSAFQTLGVNNSKWIPRFQLIAKIYAILVTLAFISIPVYFFLGLNQ
ncbi:MAG: succinate dehydrogenase cytochrome b subunit [Prevotellaceae bacterium]|jgi:succinate dehydrogenase / fumarate reductase cytochrome b subunit|nr:succinate dehydrogenase cytochrome b subunit [Prevotellaceae bacterium]